MGSARRGSNPLAVGFAKQPQANKGRVQDGIAWERFDCNRGESCWCPDGTSTPGAWRHAGVRSLLPGERQRLYSSVVERQSCKLKVLGSIPSGGYCRTRQARSKTTTTDHKPNQRGTMRTPGIEPGSQAWKACMIPLHYVRHSPPNATNDTRCPAARPTKPDMRKPN